jgi:hypothetical protein
MSDAVSESKVTEDDAEEKKSSSEIESDKAANDIADRKSSDKLTMQIKVSSPFTTYFDDKGFSISGENDTGVFDILPKHHNFISLLKPCTLIIRTINDEEQKINIGGGLMHVKADKVAVFLDI